MTARHRRKFARHDRVRVAATEYTPEFAGKIAACLPMRSGWWYVVEIRGQKPVLKRATEMTWDDRTRE